MRDTTIVERQVDAAVELEATDMNNVIEMESVRDQRLEELTQRALQLPRYRRLAVIVAILETRRESRRIKAPAADGFQDKGWSPDRC